jgi:DNA-binding winged helix-turn-helix (wHTH) protein
MVNHNVLRRRVLVVDADPDVLDTLVGDIAAMLAESGHPVRRVVDGDTPVDGAEARPAPVSGGTVTIGDLVVCADARVARRGGTTLALTRIEFDLLVELLRHRNRVLTKDALVDSVWSSDTISSNAIEARISRLRAKLEAHGPRLIHTVRGVGYVLHALPAPDAEPNHAVIELVADDLMLDLAPHGVPWPAGGRQ